MLNNNAFLITDISLPLTDLFYFYYKNNNIAKFFCQFVDKAFIK